MFKIHNWKAFDNANGQWIPANGHWNGLQHFSEFLLPAPSHSNLQELLIERSGGFYLKLERVGYAHIEQCNALKDLWASFVFFWKSNPISLLFFLNSNAFFFSFKLYSQLPFEDCNWVFLSIVTSSIYCILLHKERNSSHLLFWFFYHVL